MLEEYILRTSQSFILNLVGTEFKKEHFEGKIGHFQSKIGHFHSKIGHSHGFVPKYVPMYTYVPAPLKICLNGAILNCIISHNQKQHKCKNAGLCFLMSENLNLPSFEKKRRRFEQRLRVLVLEWRVVATLLFF